MSQYNHYLMPILFKISAQYTFQYETFIKPSNTTLCQCIYEDKPDD